MPVLVSLEVEALYCKVKATSSGHFPMKGDQKSHKSMSCVQEESGFLARLCHQPVTSLQMTHSIRTGFFFYGKWIFLRNPYTQASDLFPSAADLATTNVQGGIKFARRNINNLRCTDEITLMAESEEQLKSLLMKMKEESEKVGVKFNI